MLARVRPGQRLPVPLIRFAGYSSSIALSSAMTPTPVNYYSLGRINQDRFEKPGPWSSLHKDPPAQRSSQHKFPVHRGRSVPPGFEPRTQEDSRVILCPYNSNVRPTRMSVQLEAREPYSVGGVSLPQAGKGGFPGVAAAKHFGRLCTVAAPDWRTSASASVDPPEW